MTSDYQKVAERHRDLKQDGFPELSTPEFSTMGTPRLQLDTPRVQLQEQPRRVPFCLKVRGTNASQMLAAAEEAANSFVGLDGTYRLVRMDEAVAEYESTDWLEGHETAQIVGWTAECHFEATVSGNH